MKYVVFHVYSWFKYHFPLFFCVGVVLYDNDFENGKWTLTTNRIKPLVISYKKIEIREPLITFSSTFCMSTFQVQKI